MSNHPMLFRTGVTVALAFALAACASNSPPPTAETPSLDQRLSDMERRIEMLEARPPIEPPYRDRAEIEAHIQALEAERAALLTRYLSEHPLIRDIDRRLIILNNQLNLLE
ncbi:MAG: hypothetical protein WAK92_04305 [Thiobacillus sp.]